MKLPELSVVISTVLHLAWAFLANFLLKKLGLVTDKEFILIYFIFLSMFYKNVIDLFYKGLILNPAGVATTLLQLGLQGRAKYAQKLSKEKLTKNQ